MLCCPLERLRVSTGAGSRELDGVDERGHEQTWLPCDLLGLDPSMGYPHSSTQFSMELRLVQSMSSGTVVVGFIAC